MPYAIKCEALLLCDSLIETPFDPFLQTYFHDTHRVFLDRLKRLKALTRSLTATEERELRTAVEELIRAKNLAHGKR